MSLRRKWLLNPDYGLDFVHLISNQLGHFPSPVTKTTYFFGGTVPAQLIKKRNSRVRTPRFTAQSTLASCRTLPTVNLCFNSTPLGKHSKLTVDEFFGRLISGQGAPSLPSHSKVRSSRREWRVGPYTRSESNQSGIHPIFWLKLHQHLLQRVHEI